MNEALEDEDFKDRYILSVNDDLEYEYDKDRYMRWEVYHCNATHVYHDTRWFNSNPHFNLLIRPLICNVTIV